MLSASSTPPPEVLAALPIFPLPNVVLLPGMVLPLNVFEPRYLELVTREGGLAIPFDSADLPDQVVALADLPWRPPELLLSRVPDPTTIHLDASSGTWAWEGTVDATGCARSRCGVVTYDPVRNSVTPAWPAREGSIHVEVSYEPAR